MYRKTYKKSHYVRIFIRFLNEYETYQCLKYMELIHFLGAIYLLSRLSDKLILSYTLKTLKTKHNTARCYTYNLH